MAISGGHTAGQTGHVDDHNLLDAALSLKLDTTVANANFQPLDSDLTAIAALTTTTFGRSLLALLDAAAGRTALGLGTAATAATTDFQPADSDLTAIAALTTTAYGRAFLALLDAPAGRTALGLGTAATAAAADFQPVDSDLTAIAALTTTAYGRSLLAVVDAAGLRTTAGLGSLAVKNAIAVPTDVTATGTPSATTFLRGDGSWSAPAGGGGGGFGLLPTTTFKAAAFIVTPSLSLGTNAVSAGFERAMPIVIPFSTTATALGVEVTGAGSGGSVVRLGLRSNDGGAPGTLLVDAGTVDGTTTGFKQAAISQALSPGLYWVTMATQGAPATPPTVRTLGGSATGIGPPFLVDATAGTAPDVSQYVGYFRGATGAFAAAWAFEGFLGPNNTPRVSVKVS